MSDPAQTVTPIHEALALIDKWAKSDAPPEIRDDGGVVISARELARLAEIIASFAPKPLLPSPSEREELASVISHAINFDDGAHHLSMGDDGEPCRACQDVADAVLAKGYSKRSSPSSQEPAAWQCMMNDANGGPPIPVAESHEERHRDHWLALAKEEPRWGFVRPLYDHPPASPSSAGQEVREAVREALTKLAISDLTDEPFGANDEDILAWRDREYPALSAGETPK